MRKLLAVLAVAMIVAPAMAGTYGTEGYSYTSTFLENWNGMTGDKVPSKDVLEWDEFAEEWVVVDTVPLTKWTDGFGNNYLDGTMLKGVINGDSNPLTGEYVDYGGQNCGGGTGGDRLLTVYKNNSTENTGITMMFQNDTGDALSNFELYFDLEVIYTKRRDAYGAMNKPMTVTLKVPGGSSQLLWTTDRLVWTTNLITPEGDWGYDVLRNEQMDAFGMSQRNVGGIVDVSALGIAAGQLFEVEFKVASGTVTGGSSNNKTFGFGVDNVRVPEPATMSLLAIGGIGALIRRRR